ncbi:MAG: hypothetical protein ACYC3G_04205 [Minisyncoccota bacterium]
MDKKIQDMGRGEFLELMRTLQVDHLEPKIKSIVEEVMKAERAAFWVPAERHYNEHAHLEKCVKTVEEKEANHEFVSTVRTGVGYAGKIAFGAAMLALAGFIGGAIIMAIRAAFAAKGGS